MNAEHEILASAYVDGELTADERRIAEADPAVMAEVAELRALRDQLADVPPPNDAAREAAIAAAMGVFHERFGEATASVAASAPRPRMVDRVADTVSHAASDVVSFWRRPAAMRLLGAAAAVLVIGLLGVVIVAGLRTDGDDSTSFDAASEAPADEPAEEAADEPASESAGGALAESMERDADDAAETATAELEFAAEVGVAADEPASAPADEPAEEPADDQVADAAVAVDPAMFFTFEHDAEPLPITSSLELTAAGGYLLELERTRPEVLTPTPNTACGGALAAATVLVDDAPIEVVVVVDDDLGQVIAYGEQCIVVLDAPAP